MSIDKIVNVQISRQTAGVEQAGFGTPLILGPNAVFSNEVRTYTNLEGVIADFAISTPEYLMASAVFSQSPRIESVKIAKTAAPVAQVVTMTPTVLNSTLYSVTIKGVAYTFTSGVSATATEIVTGLKASISAAVLTHNVAATGTTTLVLTAQTAGQSFSYANSTNLTAVNTTANVGIASDILAAQALDDDFYFVLTTSSDDVTIKEASATVEAMRKIYVARSASAAIATASTTDVASVLSALSLDRTVIIYTTNVSEYSDAAFVGRCAPLNPGSETWANKTLKGVTADKPTASAQTFLDNKNVNYYISIAGVSVTINGKTIGGEYIDVIRFIDWLQARMQEQLFGDIARLDKIPFTDGGIAIIEADVRAILERGVSAGGIASSQDYTVTVPKAKDISPSDKAARHLTGVKFTAVLAGAIHKVSIAGVVTL